jgi:hypothetical protein
LFFSIFVDVVFLFTAPKAAAKSSAKKKKEKGKILKIYFVLDFQSLEKYLTISDIFLCVLSVSGNRE